MKEKFQGRERTRQMVRERDAETCQRCKKIWKKGQKRFDVHHLDTTLKMSRRYDKVADMDGMITLCRPCHQNVHLKLRDAEIGVRIRTKTNPMPDLVFSIGQKINGLNYVPLSEWAKKNGYPYIKAKDAAYKGRLSKIVKRRMIKKVQIMIPADHKWL